MTETAATIRVSASTAAESWTRLWMPYRGLSRHTGEVPVCCFAARARHVYDAGVAGLRSRGECGGPEAEPGYEASAVRSAMEALYDVAKCIDAVAPVLAPAHTLELCLPLLTLLSGAFPCSHS